MSNSKVKPYVLYNKPPNTKLLSSHSEMPSCTIANTFTPNSQHFSRPNPESGPPQEQSTEKLGHWRYRHLYPFGYGYNYNYGRWGYPYGRYGYGCGYGYPCYRGGIYGYPWY